MPAKLIVDGLAGARLTLVLAHGAGAAMDSPFMSQVAKGVAAGGGVRVVRFEFPYMAARRSGGRRGAPDREPVLLESWRDVIAELGNPSRMAIGGKSMGGRIASMVADEEKVAGLVCLGYPFHPPGNPARTRTAHLEHLRTPALIIQGERDSFGRRDEVAGYRLSPAIHIEWIADGDHSFKPRASSGHTVADNLSHANELMREYVAGHR